MPDQDRFSEHTAKPTWLGQPDHGDDHMHQKNKAVAHRANPTKPGKPSFHVIFGIRHGHVFPFFIEDTDLQHCRQGFVLDCHTCIDLP
jgi:hypothetical protein